MTPSKNLIMGLSLILGISGCQTLNDNLDKTSTDTRTANLSVATAFLEAGQPDKAMFELRPILERDPKNAEAHTLMGLTHLALRNPVKGTHHLEIAWNIKKTAVHALNLSSAYLESGQLDKAQRIIASGLSLKETPAYRNSERFYHNLGLIAEKRGNLVAAEKSFRKALSENPTFYLSRAKIASLLDERKKFDAAKSEWEQARLACPACFEATDRLARYYRNRGDLRTAIGLVQDYRRIEGLKLTDAKNAAELEAQLNAERLRSAQQTVNERPANKSR